MGSIVVFPESKALIYWEACKVQIKGTAFDKPSLPISSYCCYYLWLTIPINDSNTPPTHTPQAILFSSCSSKNPQVMIKKKNDFNHCNDNSAKTGLTVRVISEI